MARILIIGLTAGYRALFQIKNLELRSSDSVLRRGSAIETTVVSYARIPIEVRLELVQGTHSETVALQRVPKNTWAFLDPRTREASLTEVLAADVLDRFAPGEARVRATATGGLQLGHEPAPLTREVAVKIERTVSSERWAGGQWAVGSGQWAVGSGQWAGGRKGLLPLPVGEGWGEGL